MALLYDELVALCSRYWTEMEVEDSYEANADAMDELRKAIIRISNPESVGDVMALPGEGLRRDGLIHLIERDASDEYQSIEGYVDFVMIDLNEEAITPALYGFDGKELCEWIDQTFPVAAD